MMMNEITVDFGLVSTIVSGVVLVINGWLVMLVRGFNADIESLTHADKDMTQKISDLSQRLGSDYVLRADFKQDLREQTDTLTRVMDKMESRLTLAATTATSAANTAAATAASALSAATAAAAAALARAKSD
jgi:hypothetical protein